MYIPSTLEFDSNEQTVIYTKHINSAADMLRTYELLKVEQETYTDWSQLLRDINDELQMNDTELYPVVNMFMPINSRSEKVILEITLNITRWSNAKSERLTDEILYPIVLKMILYLKDEYINIEDDDLKSYYRNTTL